MRRALSAASVGAWIVAIPVALLSIHGCARTLRHVESQPTKSAISELWQEPLHLASRDLFHGAGGPKLTPPRVTYTCVERKTAGTNPGYDVRDPQGRLWSVKLGEEAQSEVTASRVLWAVGFHQPPTYYVDRCFASPAVQR